MRFHLKILSIYYVMLKQVQHDAILFIKSWFVTLNSCLPVGTVFRVALF